MSEKKGQSEIVIVSKLIQKINISFTLGNTTGSIVNGKKYSV
jgi:hypothetical protein